MNAPDGVLTKIVAYGRGKNFALAITQRQRTKRVKNLTIRPWSSTVEVSAMITSLLDANRGALGLPSATNLKAYNKNWEPIPAHL